MDTAYLNLLVHPLYKTSLCYNERSQLLTDDLRNETFRVKDDVPILLLQDTDESLTETDRHTNVGSRFQYKEHYQNDAATYDYFRIATNTPEREEQNRLHQYILSEIPASASWVLDAGCGGGWVADALKYGGKSVISMDISDLNPLRVTKNNPFMTHYGLVADVFNLPLKNNSVDCIVAAEIIEHVSNPKRFIEALYTVLKPGGRLIITTPYNENVPSSLCIHCNRLTPHNAHLHSFTEKSILSCLPKEAKRYKTRVFNNKILVRLGIQRLFSFLPLPLWHVIDTLFNTLSEKRSYRLMLVIEK